jgi:hypothetical protein
MLGVPRTLDTGAQIFVQIRRVVNAMSLDLDDWLQVEQIMEEENHVLLQAETTKPTSDPPPQLLMILTHAAKGSSSPATFSTLIQIGGITGVALIDSGSTDSFIDYTFTSKSICSIVTATPMKVKVAWGGGYLDLCRKTRPTPYFIYHEHFFGQFRLMKLKGMR